jgi:hypothetical protein
MIKKFFLLFAVILLIASCSQTEKEQTTPKYNKAEIDQIVDEHLENTITVFRDSMNAKKGFLGWRNIRDYVGLGNQNFRDRTLATWGNVYDNKELESKIEQNLVAENRVDLQLGKSDEHIGQYIHKISLSTFVLILEGLFELLLILVFDYVFVAVAVYLFFLYQFTYGGWKRMSKKRNDEALSLADKVGKYTTYLAILVTIIIGVYSGDFSNDALSDKIKIDIQNEISAQIEEKI